MPKIADVVKKQLSAYQKDKTRLLDIIRDVQADLGSVSDEAIDQISEGLKVSQVDVEGVVSFYHFFSRDPVGKYAVYLNNSAVAMMKGVATIAATFEKEAGCKFGQISADGLIGLQYTSCIGMNDQEPAAIINGVVFTNLNAHKVMGIVAAMRAGKKVREMVKVYGDGQNQSALVKSMVNNNIRLKGKVLFAPYETGSGLKKAVSMSQDAVLDEIKKSNLRGRGGAGFPTGLKWEICKKAKGDRHYVVCNADEGEPGTFKDRVMLTEMPRLVFEGMAIAGYLVGAEEGVIYLRAEYVYLKKYLEKILEELRKKNILGKNAGGKRGFNFDVRIKMGGGAYVCGEESALIESAEGKRGEPRNRPPFPVLQGYLGYPTTINNVETFASAVKIVLEGGNWYAAMGTEKTKGTKLLSISGDCNKPGVYEVEWGLVINDMLEMVDARDTFAVVVGGPSGNIIGAKDFGRRLCYNDLPTGGAIIIINKDRNLLDIVHNFMDFFVKESCGWCTPCRAGNLLLRGKLEKIMAGNACETDLKEAEEWCRIIKAMSRCGLGQTSPNPMQTTLRNFRDLYENRIKQNCDYVSGFNLAKAVQESCAASGRTPYAGGH
jgi:[NiFe] hydrogenase diaphorase moiety large subunit